jgi:uncharacterized membrane protein YfhO
VNGVSTDIQNHQGVRLLNIQPGINIIEMRYIPKNIYFGAIITLMSLMIIMLIQLFKLNIPKFKAKKVKSSLAL